MAESWFQMIGRKLGRKRHNPDRETYAYPRLVQLGSPRDDRMRPTFKPIARNIRYFSNTPYARRAINAIKNPIAELDWEITPLPGVDLNPELERQIELATYCFAHPNHMDSFRTLIEQTVEDVLCGAGAIETRVGGDAIRPLWLFPVDGLSIQIYAGWNGDQPNEPRFYQSLGYGGLGTVSTDGIQLRNDELIYIRPNPTTATPFGVGPLEVAFMTISRLLGVGDFAGNLATNSKPSAALYLPGADDRTLGAFRSYWRNEVEGQGQFPLLGGPKDSKAETIRLWPDGDKALYMEWQEFLIREIATAFDLAPQNLGLEADVNRNTSEVAEDRDWDSAIKPCANSIASYLTRDAVHGRLGFYQLMFKWKGIDREDEAATAEIYATYYENNVVTPNEQREKLGLPPSKSPYADMLFAEAEEKLAAANVPTDKPVAAKKPTSKEKR